MTPFSIRPLAATAALTLLSACASTPKTTPSPVPTPVASTPAPVEGYDWFMNAEPGTKEISLSYGVAESDDVPFDLSCARGSGALQLLRPAAHGAQPSILVESGGDTETYPATSEESGLHDGVYLMAGARSSDPVFQRFRRLGWLAVWDGEHRAMMAAHPGSGAKIEQFFAACG